MSRQIELLEGIANSVKRMADANETAVGLWKRVDERTSQPVVQHDSSLMKKLDDLLDRIKEREVAAPPAESEAVQLLERWLKFWVTAPQSADEASEMDHVADNLTSTTRALLAKLKGGK